MRLRDIPKDVVIGVSFVAVFLLAAIPNSLLLLSPDLWLAIKAARARRQSQSQVDLLRTLAEEN
jgi:hypothetical protein